MVPAADARLVRAVSSRVRPTRVAVLATYGGRRGSQENMGEPLLTGDCPVLLSGRGGDADDQDQHDKQRV